jgi:hypothetical protein
MSGCSESFGMGTEPGCNGADWAQLLGDEGYCVVFDGSDCCDRSPPRVTAEASAERQSESGQRGRWPVSDWGATSVRLYGGLAGLEASKSAEQRQDSGRDWWRPTSDRPRRRRLHEIGQQSSSAVRMRH